MRGVRVEFVEQIAARALAHPPRGAGGVTAGVQPQRDPRPFCASDRDGADAVERRRGIGGDRVVGAEIHSRGRDGAVLRHRGVDREGRRRLPGCGACFPPRARRRRDWRERTNSDAYEPPTAPGPAPRDTTEVELDGTHKGVLARVYRRRVASAGDRTARTDDVPSDDYGGRSIKGAGPHCLPHWFDQQLRRRLMAKEREMAVVIEQFAAEKNCRGVGACWPGACTECETVSSRRFSPLPAYEKAALFCNT